MTRITEPAARREAWPDIVRGLCALAVVLSHIPITPPALTMYVTPFMLPGFFLVSGYFTKTFDGRLRDYFYYRVGKELLIKLLFCFSLTTFSFKVILRLVTHPASVPEWLYNTLATMFLKPRAIFFSVLVLCSVLFILIEKLCQGRTRPMLLTGGALALTGMLLSRPRIMRWWSWDTALVCLLFFIIGFCLRREKVFERVRFRPRHALMSGGLFFGAVTAHACLFGVDRTEIVVASNIWQTVPTTLLFVLTGNVFILTLSHTLPPENPAVRGLMYIGRHALVYFMFGGPIIAYLHYFAGRPERTLSPALSGCLAVTLPLMLVLTVALTLIPCRLVDRFCPVLNGQFRLPPLLHPSRGRTRLAAAAGVFAALALGGLLAAVCTGRVIPNQIYARHYDVRGVDISSRLGTVDWQTLAGQDIVFVYIQATEGSDRTDARFAENWEAVSGTGLAVGACHTFRYDCPGRAQAAHFIATVPASEQALPPVVDVELYEGIGRRPPRREAVASELRELLRTLEAHYGKRPILRVTEASYVTYIWDVFADYDFWYRSVVTNPPDENRWLIWQYTDRMRLPGCDSGADGISVSVFRGSRKEWNALFSVGNRAGIRPN